MGNLPSLPAVLRPLISIHMSVVCTHNRVLSLRHVELSDTGVRYEVEEGDLKMSELIHSKHEESSALAPTPLV